MEKVKKIKEKAIREKINDILKDEEVLVLMRTPYHKILFICSAVATITTSLKLQALSIINMQLISLFNVLPCVIGPLLTIAGLGFKISGNSSRDIIRDSNGEITGESRKKLIQTIDTLTTKKLSKSEEKKLLDQFIIDLRDAVANSKGDNSIEELNEYEVFNRANLSEESDCECSPDAQGKEEYEDLL
jgi:hypothetical protein